MFVRFPLSGFVAIALCFTSWASPAQVPEETDEFPGTPRIRTIEKRSRDREVQVPAIEFKPGTRLKKDILLQLHRPWHQRVLISPFKERIAGKPWQEQALAFVTAATDDFYLSLNAITPEFQSWEELGKAAVKAGADDVLVQYLVERLRVRRKVDADAAGRMQKIFKKAMGAPIGSALKSFIARDYGYIKKKDDSLEKQIVALLEETLADDTYQPDEGAIFLHHQIASRWVSILTRRPDLVEPVYAKLPFEKWVHHTLMGKVASAHGWKARGNGFSNTVTEEGWRILEEKMRVARAELWLAWKLAPHQPEAAASMVGVLNTAGEADPGESVRVWFDRAVAAQFDYLPAYSMMMNSLRPRWGGSLEELFAFGEACAATGRYDTHVPLLLYQARELVMEDLGNWEGFFRRPRQREALLNLTKALIKEPSRVAEKSRRMSQLAVEAWFTGDFALALQMFATIEKLHPDSLALVDKLDLTEARLRGESVVLSSPAKAPYEVGIAKYEDGALDEARSTFEKALELTPEEGRALISNRLSVVKIEQALAGGEWVKIVPQPGLWDWTMQMGDWSADEAGNLINKGRKEAAFIYHQARVGPNFEVRAECDVKCGRNYYRSCGIGFGFRWTSTKYWTMCHVGGRGNGKGTAHLMDRYYDSGVPGRPVKFPVSTTQLYVKALDGKVTFDVNGTRVYDAVEPGKVTTGPEDGRIGFGSYKFDIRNVTRIRNIEVRRLKAE